MKSRTSFLLLVSISTLAMACATAVVDPTTGSYEHDGGPTPGADAAAKPDPTPGADATPDPSATTDSGSTADDTSVAIDDTGAADPDTGSPTPPADSGGCSPLSHSNGLGGSYRDCKALGTPGVAGSYSETMAREAATAWSPGATMTTTGTCGTSSCLSASDGTLCARWCFAGSLAGHVWKAKTSKCTCPYATDPSWD